MLDQDKLPVLGNRQDCDDAAGITALDVFPVALSYHTEESTLEQKLTLGLLRDIRSWIIHGKLGQPIAWNAEFLVHGDVAPRTAKDVDNFERPDDVSVKFVQLFGWHP